MPHQHHISYPQLTLVADAGKSQGVSAALETVNTISPATLRHLSARGHERDRVPVNGVATPRVALTIVI